MSLGRRRPSSCTVVTTAAVARPTRSAAGSADGTTSRPGGRGSAPAGRGRRPTPSAAPWRGGGRRGPAGPVAGGCRPGRRAVVPAAACSAGRSPALGRSGRRRRVADRCRWRRPRRFPALPTGRPSARTGPRPVPPPLSGTAPDAPAWTAVTVRAVVLADTHLRDRRPPETAGGRSTGCSTGADVILHAGDVVDEGVLADAGVDRSDASPCSATTIVGLAGVLPVVPGPRSGRRAVAMIHDSGARRRAGPGACTAGFPTPASSSSATATSRWTTRASMGSGCSTRAHRPSGGPRPITPSVCSSRATGS